MKSMSRRPANIRRKIRASHVSILLVIAVVCLSGIVLHEMDKVFPPPLDSANDYSVEVVDQNGEALHYFLNRQGRWRLKTDLHSVDPQYINMLLAYEDKRFYSHLGVDPFAIGRALWQFVTQRRVVSGGSTITMQLARLMEPRSQRSVGAKLKQMVRAIQLERRLSKREILEKYLTLAPFGGNIEGIRAGARIWFGKEPKRLSVDEAALLIALPQSPEFRRPDRQSRQAKLARNRVLQRLSGAGVLDKSELERVVNFPLPNKRISMPSSAGHLALAAVDKNPAKNKHTTRLLSKVQRNLEVFLRQAASSLGPKVSSAIMVVDAHNGDILASLGSTNLLDHHRQGWIDMTRHKRSPGSTLKPLVYGIAIEDGLILPESLIADRSVNFGGYRPTNFDQSFQGDVTVREALQLSLNVPAVQLLDAVSVPRFLSRIQRAGIHPETAAGTRPGLSLVLGGASLTLQDLVQLYVNFVYRGSTPLAIGDAIRSKPGPIFGRNPLSKVANWHVTDMLSGIREPVGSKPRNIAYKTGTSYGYRDAWAIGYDGRYVIGVWVGRPDNAPVPGISGIKTAAPILFEAFEKSALDSVPFPPAPTGALRRKTDELPHAMRKFLPYPLAEKFSPIDTTRQMKIDFPADGHELEIMENSAGATLPVTIKLKGGVPPFNLLSNGKPVISPTRRRQLYWKPNSRGTTRLTVLDSIGQAKAIEVRIR